MQLLHLFFTAGIGLVVIVYLCRALTRRRVAPTRFAADYSPEEQARLREAFRPEAENYRKFRRAILWLTLFCVGGLFLCIALVLAGCRFEGPCGQYIMVLGVVWLAGWFMLFLLLAAMPRLVCPGCNNDMGDRLGRCCPHCGLMLDDKGR